MLGKTDVKPFTDAADFAVEMLALAKKAEPDDYLLVLNLARSARTYAGQGGCPELERESVSLVERAYLDGIETETWKVKTALERGNYLDAEIALLSLKECTEKSGMEVPETADLERKVWGLAERTEHERAKNAKDPLERRMALDQMAWYAEKLRRV